MTEELDYYELDILWLKNEIKSFDLPEQDEESCDLFAEKVAKKMCKIRSTQVARIEVFKELFGVN